MTCNIDQRGRTVRIIIGSIIESAGLLLIVFAAVGELDGRWPWIAGVALAILGGFTVMQGVIGWCAFRAMIDPPSRG